MRLHLLIRIPRPLFVDHMITNLIRKQTTRSKWKATKPKHLCGKCRHPTAPIVKDGQANYATSECGVFTSTSESRALTTLSEREGHRPPCLIMCKYCSVMQQDKWHQLGLRAKRVRWQTPHQSKILSLIYKNKVERQI